MGNATKAWARGVLVLLLAVGGCGGSRKGTLSGRVTLDGQPLATGTIQFFPVDGKGQTAHGDIRDGTYTAEVSLGKMRVEITSPKVVGKREAYDTPDSETIDLIEDLIPPQYNIHSKLTADVKPGRHEENFDLKSK